MKMALRSLFFLTVIFIPFATIAQLGDLPSVAFKPGSSKLSADAQTILHAVADKLKANAKSSIELVVYQIQTKAGQQSGFDRSQLIIKFLVEKEGIDGDRITTTMDMIGGDPDTVDLKEKDAFVKPSFHGVSRGALENKTPIPPPKLLAKPAIKPKPVKKPNTH